MLVLVVMLSQVQLTVFATQCHILVGQTDIISVEMQPDLGQVAGFLQDAVNVVDEAVRRHLVTFHQVLVVVGGERHSGRRHLGDRHGETLFLQHLDGAVDLQIALTIDFGQGELEVVLLPILVDVGDTDFLQVTHPVRLVSDLHVLQEHAVGVEASQLTDQVTQEQLVHVVLVELVRAALQHTVLSHLTFQAVQFALVHGIVWSLIENVLNRAAIDANLLIVSGQFLQFVLLSRTQFFTAVDILGGSGVQFLHLALQQLLTALFQIVVHAELRRIVDSLDFHLRRGQQFLW